jgi:diaminopropionate ammonia-lyase
VSDRSSRFLLHPRFGAGSIVGGRPAGVREFHRRLPGYRSTPLHRLGSLAAELGVAELFVKDESIRLGLPAFKILGASWATYKALEELLGGEIEPWATVGDLAKQVERLTPMELVTATDGNHGRALARVAGWVGLSARIFVPKSTISARIEAIRDEGAEVVVVDGSYDDAVAAAADRAGPRTLLVSDTSWEGYDRVPTWVIEGYSTLFEEIDDELASTGERGPDLVLVPCGVGALAAAAVRHYRRHGREIRLVCVEPVGADCALQSAREGRIVKVPGPHPSMLAGLNCGTPSLVAWPDLSAGCDAFIAIEDPVGVEAVRMLARQSLHSGESGAASLAGLVDLLRAASAREVRDALGIGGQTRALVLMTEGVTDPDLHASVLAKGKP